VFDPDQQIGMPMGYDQSTITQSYPLTGVSSYYQYSRATVPDLRRARSRLPRHIRRTQLLLAEAAHRGWSLG
jgi:hypothetical protein